jgi:hypothetical protein
MACVNSAAMHCVQNAAIVGVGHVGTQNSVFKSLYPILHISHYEM